MLLNTTVYLYLSVLSSAEPRYPPNTVIPRDGNFDTHLKPMKDTYNLVYFLFHVLVSSKCVKRVR